MTLNMQKQTKSNSRGNTDLIRYMARMFGNTNIIQIMLLMRHKLNFATQLLVTTTTIDDTTELKRSVYVSVVITIFCDQTYAVSGPEKVFCPLSSFDLKLSRVNRERKFKQIVS